MGVFLLLFCFMFFLVLVSFLFDRKESKKSFKGKVITTHPYFTDVHYRNSAFNKKDETQQ